MSLLPSLTESVCELEQCHRLVGVDRYSNWPEAVIAKLPKVGGGLDPSIEAIVALKPDLVLMSVSSRASDRLEALGLTVVQLEPKTHADVRRVLGTVSDLLGVPRAQGSDRLWRVIDAGVLAAAQSLPPKAKNARVYFEVSRGPYAAGEASFIGESLTRLGVRNVVPASLGPFPRLNPEFVVRANPDIIMIGNRSMQAMVPYPGWASHARNPREPAVRVWSWRLRCGGAPWAAHGRSRAHHGTLPGGERPHDRRFAVGCAYQFRHPPRRVVRCLVAAGQRLAGRVWRQRGQHGF